MTDGEERFFRRFRFADAGLDEVRDQIAADQATIAGAAASPPTVAQLLFQAGLDKSAEYGIDEERHYLLHHRGRCYAEQGRLLDARDCLERALALRQELGDPRFIASSQAALTELSQLDHQGRDPRAR